MIVWGDGGVVCVGRGASVGGDGGGQLSGAAFSLFIIVYFNILRLIFNLYVILRLELISGLLFIYFLCNFHLIIIDTTM